MIILRSCKIVRVLIAYITVGIISNLIHHYQVFPAVVQDVILNLKFYLGIGTTIYLFGKYDYDSDRVKIKSHLKVIIFVLFVLVVLNKIVLIFPKGNVRFGIASELLFFNHPTNFAAVSFFLMVLFMLFYEQWKKDGIFIVMTLLLILSTLRFKAMAIAAAYIYFYFIVIIQKKRISFKRLVFLLPIVIIIGWDEFSFYFFSDSKMEMARGALTFTSFDIAKDCFPFGTGFGTFASAPSSDYYSKVYMLYHIDTVWGLGADWSGLVSDVFWPMVLGQTGVIGLCLYVYIVVLLFKLIHPLFNIEKRAYLSSVGVITYLLVSSIAESAFVNPISLLLAVVLGLAICKLRRKDSMSLEGGFE